MGKEDTPAMFQYMQTLTMKGVPLANRHSTGTPLKQVTAMAYKYPYSTLPPHINVLVDIVPNQRCASAAHVHARM